MVQPLGFYFIVLLPCILVLVSGFQQSICEFRVRNDDARTTRRRRHSSSRTVLLQGSLLPSWLEEFVNMGDRIPEKTSSKEQQVDKSTPATVIRLAARKYQENGASKPSSQDYTTRKESCSSIQVTAEGVMDDYNHYRTIALKSTPDRAISILTTDVMTAIRQSFSSSARNGDLGENILLKGIDFDDLQLNQQYAVGSVVLQVTEPMIPCANLCKLPYINDSSLQEPKDRIARCLALLEFLDKPGDGFRGWYAKVITPGEITVGDEFRKVLQEQESA